MLEGYSIAFDECEHHFFLGSNMDLEEASQNVSVLILSEGITLPPGFDTVCPIISVHVGEATEERNVVSAKSLNVFERAVEVADAIAMRSSFSEHFKRDLSAADAASVIIALEELIQREDNTSIFIVSSDRDQFLEKPEEKERTVHRKEQFDLLFQRATARARSRSMGQKRM